MRILITGITGFAGSHLADYLLEHEKGVEVFGIKRWRSRTETVDHLQGKVDIAECDLRDASSVKNLIDGLRPDGIFHLAAQSFVPASWNAPAESITTNTIGQLNIFEAARSLKVMPRIQIACSSEEYGMVYQDELPIKETNPLRPLSPYAVSKVAQDLLGYQYFMSFGLPVIRTRGFNHEGPRRAQVFVCSDFARQIVEIEKGLREPKLHVGNLDAIRDFTDVRDMVRAYWLALTRCKAGEAYNICSGRGYKIHEMLDMLLGMTRARIEVTPDPRRLRPSDVPVLIGDHSKFTKETGWEPTIPFEKTLQDTLDYWRERVR